MIQTSENRTNKPKLNRNKTQYLCESCNTRVWGKPNLIIVCGLCNPGVLQVIDKLHKLEQV
jgi:hypothetical protein